MVTALKQYFYREHNWGGVYLHDSKTDYELARGTASGVTIK
jgi:hypothetical protein